MFPPLPQQIKNKRNVNDKTELLADKTFQDVISKLKKENSQILICKTKDEFLKLDKTLKAQ